MAKDTYIPRDEAVDMNREFSKVREQAVKELMKYPGVLAVGVGLKEVKGEVQRKLCFKVKVTKKIAESNLQSRDQIPDSICGFPTDVNEVVVTIPGSQDSSNYRPLLGGCQIGVSSKSGSGTLGCLAKRNVDDKIVILSNWHVIVGNPDSIDGDSVGQPSHNGCCSCCACGEIADTVDGRFRTNDMDAAIALLDGQASDAIPEYAFINEILDIGLLAGSATPVVGETVWKRGRTTGLTKGQISDDNAVTATPYEFYSGLAVNRTSQWEITPIPAGTDFFLKGDSGSVSVNEHNQAVLLNYAYAQSTQRAYANNIESVESVLDISILDSSFHTSPSGMEGVPIHSTTVSPVASSLAEAMAELEAEIGHIPEGKRLLELFRVHRQELLHLVRHRREVMVAWHRYQGPAYLAHVARSVRRDNKPLPDQIKGVTLQNLLLKMTAVLQRNASPELARAVSDNYLLVMNVLSSGRSPEDWKAHLASLELAHT
jgi:hypothetical protein